MNSKPSPITFTGVTNDLVGRRKEQGYRLVDNEGGIWEYVLEQGANRRFLAFIKVPKKYKPLLGLSTAISMFNSIEKEAFKAIDKHNFKKELNPSTAKTFEELIDEL